MKKLLLALSLLTGADALAGWHVNQHGVPLVLSVNEEKTPETDASLGSVAAVLNGEFLITFKDDCQKKKASVVIEGTKVKFDVSWNKALSQCVLKPATKKGNLYMHDIFASSENKYVKIFERWYSTKGFLEAVEETEKLGEGI
ncbi:hypothetical protein [Vibrio jasicida]|uniref:hypothetical protein n=1 Tax=Vibrio jasicida TaxID=766224 RepID=UPI000CE4D446|nr:hypothetical protein [Vibrio jasicida]